MAPSKQPEKPRAASPIEDCIVVNTSRLRTFPSGEDRDDHAQYNPNVCHRGSRRVGTKTADLASDSDTESSLDDEPTPGQARRKPQSQPSSCRSQHPLLPSTTTRNMRDATKSASRSAARDAKRGPSDPSNASRKHQKRDKKVSAMPKGPSRTPLASGRPILNQPSPTADISSEPTVIPSPNVDPTILSIGQSTSEQRVSQASNEVITPRQAEGQLQPRQDLIPRESLRAAAATFETITVLAAEHEQTLRTHALHYEKVVDSCKKLEQQVADQRLANAKLQTSFDTARAEWTETGASQRSKIGELEKAVDDANKRPDDRDHVLKQAQDKNKEQAAELTELRKRLDDRELILEQAQNTNKMQVAKLSQMKALERDMDFLLEELRRVSNQAQSRDAEQKAKISELENNRRMDKHMWAEKEQQQQKEVQWVLRLLRDAEATRQNLEASLKKSQDVAKSQEKRMKEVSGSIRAFMAASTDEPDKE